MTLYFHHGEAANRGIATLDRQKRLVGGVGFVRSADESHASAANLRELGQSNLE